MWTKICKFIFLKALERKVSGRCSGDLVDNGSGLLGARIDDLKLKLRVESVSSRLLTLDLGWCRDWIYSVKHLV